jgi:hypothetical protein
MGPQEYEKKLSVIEYACMALPTRVDESSGPEVLSTALGLIDELTDTAQAMAKDAKQERSAGQGKLDSRTPGDYDSQMIRVIRVITLAWERINSIVSMLDIEDDFLQGQWVLHEFLGPRDTYLN